MLEKDRMYSRSGTYGVYGRAVPRKKIKSALTKSVTD